MSSRSLACRPGSAKHALLLEGIGWAMPREMVQADIDSGKLVELHLPDHRGGRIYGLSALWRRDQPPGPATRWLLDRFVEWNLGSARPSV